MSLEDTKTLPPAWFRRAMTAPCESRFVEVAGCPIHYLRWGDPQRPGLVLVPGSGGHAHWFSHVAPLLADQFHVVAMDLAGCGDSGHRNSYSLDLIISEIMAVCADSGMLAADVPPILVGHSIGGQFIVRTAIAHGEALLGVIAVDALRYTKLAKDSASKAFDGPRPASRPPRIYPTRESAVARFRLHPDPAVPIEAAYVLDHIARHSVRAVEGGWSWKFDNALTSVVSLGLELKDALRGLRCHAAAIYGESTHLADETVVEAMTAITHGEVPVFVIPGTSHYPMIDSPFVFVAAVKGIALTWVAAVKLLLSSDPASGKCVNGGESPQ
jgi:pimeloyl-ACP methyl ester carboxylesterase